MKLGLVLGRAADNVVELPRRRSSAITTSSSLATSELAWIAEGVSREMALSIPAMLSCRNLVVGAAVQMGIYRYRGDERLEPGSLLSKPDPSTTWPATLGGTIDDLAFYGRAYWRVLDRDAEGFPVRARWTPFVDVTPATRSTGGAWAELTGYTVAGVRGELGVDELIRFDSPLPGLLAIGGRTLAAAIELEQAARRLAAVELPAGVLKNEGSEVSDEEGRTIIADFQTSRRENGIAFLQGISYTREGLNAADLQLVEARANVATDVARLWSVPVAMVGASPSGGASALLYSNLSQQLAILVSSAVSPYLRTVEDTIAAALPRGQSVAFDVQTFLRSDPAAAADYAIALYGAGLITVEEARGYLGIPGAITSPDLTPGKV
jgi:phage portal protein BeeE